MNYLAWLWLDISLRLESFLYLDSVVWRRDLPSAPQSATNPEIERTDGKIGKKSGRTNVYDKKKTQEIFGQKLRK